MHGQENIASCDNRAKQSAQEPSTERVARHVGVSWWNLEEANGQYFQFFKSCELYRGSDCVHNLPMLSLQDMESPPE